MIATARHWSGRRAKGAGRPVAPVTMKALLGAVRHRRGLVADRKVLQQRLHDQLQRCALAGRPRPVTAARWPLTIRPARRCWGVRPRLLSPITYRAVPGDLVGRCQQMQHGPLRTPLAAQHPDRTAVLGDPQRIKQPGFWGKPGGIPDHGVVVLDAAGPDLPALTR
jgi:hypothetical protein